MNVIPGLLNKYKKKEPTLAGSLKEKFEIILLDIAPNLFGIRNGRNHWLREDW